MKDQRPVKHIWRNQFKKDRPVCDLKPSLDSMIDDLGLFNDREGKICQFCRRILGI